METHGPIEAAYLEKMNALAEVLDDILNDDKKGKDRTTGFVLLAYDFDDKGRLNYISNSRREDVLCAMREFIARSEGRVINEELGQQ